MLVIDSGKRPRNFHAVGMMILGTSLLFANTVVRAQASAQQQTFEVASIRRNLTENRPWLAPPVAGRFTATNISVKLLIGVAWPQKIAGGPSWVDTDGYDVSAIMPSPNTSAEDFKVMVQNLLRDRFVFKSHLETREAKVYALVPAKNGLKLPDAKPEACISGRKADPQAGCGEMDVTSNSITNQKISMEWFSAVLERLLGRPVVNKTGFTGSFHVQLKFAPLAPGTDSTEPSLSEALEKQLGLKLQPEKGSEEVLVIDHIERPSEN